MPQNPNPDPRSGFCHNCIHCGHISGTYWEPPEDYCRIEGTIAEDSSLSDEEVENVGIKIPCPYWTLAEEKA